MTGEPRLSRWRSSTAEATVLAMACLSPWAFGSVEAWAELCLDLGIALLAVLGLWGGRRPHWSRYLVCAPSMAIAGLCVLALLQSAPVSEGFFRRLVPESAAVRARLLPRTPERVAGDTSAPVALPPAALSREPEASIQVAARLAAAWILFQGVLGLGGGRPALRRLGVALTVNATLLALFSLVQSLTWNGKIFWIRESPQTYGWFAGGPFVSHNHLAAYLNLGLGFALGFLMTGSLAGAGPRRRSSRLWAAYVVGVLITGIIASHSRSGFVAMSVSLAVIGSAFALGTGKALRIGAVGAGVMALVVALMLAAGDNSALPRIASILSPVAYSDRLEIWRESARAWMTSPVWGMGLGSFQVAMAPFFHHDRGVIFTRAENEYLDMLVEGGVVGLGLALSLLVSIVRLGWRALGKAPTPQDRAMILSAMFGVLALAIQGLGDFCLHIPGVAVPAVILVAYLCGLALDAPDTANAIESSDPRPARRGLPLIRLATVALSLVVLCHGYRLARAEAVLADSGIPMPGSAPQAGSERAREDVGGDAQATLERRRAKLMTALRFRPDWAEGHLRLGVTLLDLYAQVASEWIGETEKDESRVAVMSDPLWLHGIVHSAGGDGATTASTLLQHEPIGLYLAPAARSFLEARRCAPTLALPHARLASLDFLLEGGDPSATYARRALELAGAQVHVLGLAAEVAVQVEDLDLAARCWRRWLEADGSAWEKVADAAMGALPPDRILNDVLPPSGRLTLLFADRLYSDPENGETRERFLKEAIARLPADDVADSERLHIEAITRQRLGDRERARQRMEAALALEPLRLDWRKTLVGWLLESGDPGSARRHALVGLQLGPEDPALRRALESATDSLARGEQAPDRPRDELSGRSPPLQPSILQHSENYQK